MMSIGNTERNAAPQRTGNVALFVILVVVVLGLVLMPLLAWWLVQPQHWFKYATTLFQGLVCGTLFSHVSLAAGWWNAV